MAKKHRIEITLDAIRRTHAERNTEITRRLGEFRSIRESRSDRRYWEELVFCLFTGGCSARMGMRSVDAVRGLLSDGTAEQLAAALKGSHRYPNARSAYIVHCRTFLRDEHEMRLVELLDGFECDLERRDWLVREKGIKGLGYKEASHFLRNIGFSGYAILDKHVLQCLADLKIIENAKPPNTRSRYLMVEQNLKELATATEIPLDELDLVLWSMRTGEILK